MSKFKESEAVLARCSSKKGALKNFTNHRGKAAMKPPKPPRTPLFTEHL